MLRQKYLQLFIDDAHRELIEKEDRNQNYFIPSDQLEIGMLR